jgi:hypothetical protein
MDVSSSLGQKYNQQNLESQFILLMGCNKALECNGVMPQSLVEKRSAVILTASKMLALPITTEGLRNG